MAEMADGRRRHSLGAESMALSRREAMQPEAGTAPGVRRPFELARNLPMGLASGNEGR